MKKFFFAISLLAAVGAAQAQNIVDAGRFGTTDIAGTARYRSMGGAFGAIGGDPTCMTDNPAGMAIFRGTNQFSFSPTLNVTKTATDGTVREKDSKTGFSVSNLAYVLSIRPEAGHLVNFNFGIGFNHSEGVHRKYKMTNDNPTSSFGTYLAVMANNALCAEDRFDDPGYLATKEAWNNANMPLVGLMGYDTYAIDDVVDQHGIPLGGVEAYNDACGLDAYQRMAVTEKNRTDEYNFNLSANFDDTFYAGFTLSVVDFNSTILTDLYEDYDYNYNGDYTEYSNDLETKGTGVNIKLGVIYRPTNAWRIGAAVHSPTWYNMRDFYNGRMLTNDERCKGYTYASDNGSYEYRYKYYPPWEFQFSTEYVIGTKAILSFEYDLKDFTTAKYSSSDNISYKYMNELLKANMQKMHTFKAGVEYRITDALSIRGGYAHQSSPYTKQFLNDDYGCTVWSEVDKYGHTWGDDRTFMYDSSTKTNYSILDDTHYISGGIGYSFQSFFVDFSVTDRIQNEKIAAFPTTQDVYFDDNWNCIPIDSGVWSDHINMRTNTWRYELTLGWRF